MKRVTYGLLTTLRQLQAAEDEAKSQMLGLFEQDVRARPELIDAANFFADRRDENHKARLAAMPALLNYAEHALRAGFKDET